jgi:hypothetical protein
VTARATRWAALSAFAGLSLTVTTIAFGASHESPVVVASGQWDGHAWRLEAVDQGSLHCYRIAVGFPFTRYAPPHTPNCAFSGGGIWNAFTVCPLAFAYGVADPAAATLRIRLQGGQTVGVHTITRRGVRYFASRIPCNARVVGVDQLDADGRVIVPRR